ncbi:MAG: F0F1 ATP synthase subunit epsilon [Nocardioides sp.]|uniref:F0F1 ATP synthase subunit epsilon n=1 Tax=Nocardioides sp. TaxID=35761 RepID=UPI0039E2B029
MAEGDVLFVDVVAADRRIWEGEALSVIARTSEGDIGILPNHEPLLAVLVPCAAEVLTADGKRELIAIDEGFISVADNRVALLTQYGRLAHEISLPEAEREFWDARKKRELGDTSEETRQHHDRARAQIAVARKAQQAS